MPQFLFDTDHLTLYEHDHPPLMQRLVGVGIGAVAVSPVSMEEALRGRLAALARHRKSLLRIQAYARLVSTVDVFHRLPIVAFDQASESEFQRLYALRLRIGMQDLKIAAVALANGLTLLTRNRRDFTHVPGVTLEDWSV